MYKVVFYVCVADMCMFDRCLLQCSYLSLLYQCK